MTVTHLLKERIYKSQNQIDYILKYTKKKHKLQLDIFMILG